MILHSEIEPPALRSLIRKEEVCLGGNRRQKIFGTLACASGKRLLRSNRVFFGSREEAIQCGYRPCGHCMKNKNR